MPELPDLTLYAKNLRAQVLDKSITTVDVYNQRKVNVPGAAFKQALQNAQITAINRDGKELFFSLSNGKTFAVHLMLSGRFTLLPYLDTHSVNAKIITVAFDGGEALVVSDRQGMCRVTLNPRPTGVPDAMSDKFTYVYFQRLIKLKPRLNIKAFLIDQQIVRGIGNAYVDEILYHADIAPQSITGKIPEEALQRLYASIEWVLTDALGQLERINPDAIAGEERSFLRVHHPKKKATDRGEEIVCAEVAGKRTYFVRSQQLYI